MNGLHVSQLLDDLSAFNMSRSKALLIPRLVSENSNCKTATKTGSLQRNSVVLCDNDSISLENMSL